MDKNWRTSIRNSHVKRFTHLLDAAIESDIVFLVGKDKDQVKAHKGILITGSEYFKKLFSDEKDKHCFEIADVDKHNFRLILKFLYTGESTEKIEELLPLMVAASKFCIPDLVKICEEQLSGGLNVQCALRLLRQAVNFKESLTEEVILKFICKNGVQFLLSPEFLELSVEEILKILTRDDLHVKDEAQVFDWILKWSIAECERKKCPRNSMKAVLKNVLYQVRFNQMEAAHFENQVLESGLLSNEQIFSALFYFTDKRGQSISRENVKNTFNPKPRTPYLPTGEEHILKRLVRRDIPILNPINQNAMTICTAPMFPMVEKTILFKSSSVIWVTSLAMNATSSISPNLGADNVTVRIQIRDMEDNVKASHAEDVSGVQGRTKDVYHVKFPESVRISRDTWHSANIGLTVGYYLGASYFSADVNNGGCVEYNLQTGTTSKIIKFQFKTLTQPFAVGNTDAYGFLPEIGFKVD